MPWQAVVLKTRCHSGWSVLTLGSLGNIFPLRSMLLCTLQGYIRDRMQAGYDPEYLHQVFDFIVYSISCMEAPARRESTQKGYAEVLSGFAEAGAGGSERAGQRIRVSLDASSTPEVRTPTLPQHVRYLVKICKAGPPCGCRCSAA